MAKLTWTEAFRHMSGVTLLRDKTGTRVKGGVLSEWVPKGAKSCVLAAEPAPVTPKRMDILGLGSQDKEPVVVEAYDSSTRTVTFASETRHSHIAGESVVEQVEVRPGTGLSEDGVTYNVETKFRNVRSATTVGTWARIPSDDERLGFLLLNVSAEHQRLILGSSEWFAFRFTGVDVTGRLLQALCWDIQILSHDEEENGESDMSLEFTAQNIVLSVE